MRKAATPYDAPPWRHCGTTPGRCSPDTGQLSRAKHGRSETAGRQAGRGLGGGESLAAGWTSGGGARPYNPEAHATDWAPQRSTADKVQTREGIGHVMSAVGRENHHGAGEWDFSVGGNAPGNRCETVFKFRCTRFTRTRLVITSRDIVALPAPPAGHANGLRRKCVHALTMKVQQLRPDVERCDRVLPASTEKVAGSHRHAALGGERRRRAPRNAAANAWTAGAMAGHSASQ